jgi:murein L,D-transpeptidase YcbB/YkuD
MPMRSRCLAAFVLTLMAVACGSESEESTRAPNAHLQAAASETAPALFGGDAQAHGIWQETRRFYEQNGYQLAWSDGSRPRRVMNTLISGIRAAPEEGLDPARYDVEALAAARDAFDPARAAETDLRFTHAYLKYVWHLTYGTIKPETVDSKWHAAKKSVDLATTLRTALEDERIEQSLKALAPAAPQYHGLRTQLARYRAAAGRGEWPKVPAAPVLGPGARHEVVPVLRRRLAASGDLDAGADLQRDVLDDSLVDALERLQERHGLAVDGKYTPALAAELNIPVSERIQQIAVNMDRWRWMPADLGQRYLFVNIPGFRLDAFEKGRSVLDMKVVTGRQQDPTPVLSEQMTHIVFSPYWNIPASILKNEIMPRLTEDPGYLARNNIEMVDNPGTSEEVRFRQKPGPGNSLGLVKFMFPNAFNVYLHDTPADSLFNRIERDFSHGCVRLERPLDLAKYVLRDQPEWTEERMTAAMNAGAEQTVKLTQPIPIYLAYFTAWEDHGSLQFRSDVYGHDRAHRSRMQ